MTTIAGKVLEQKKDWKAHWCWTGHVPRPWNTYVYFRKVVELPSMTHRVVVRVSADALYTLYVNEHRVHQGPARCYPQHQAYDTLDLTGLFRPGRNIISVIAYQFGAPTFQRVYRDANGFLFDGVAECQGTTIPLHTPEGWMCRPAKGWKQNTVRQAIQLGFQEHFDADADLDPSDWMTDQFETTEAKGGKRRGKLARWECIHGY